MGLEGKYIIRVIATIGKISLTLHLMVNINIWRKNVIKKEKERPSKKFMIGLLESRDILFLPKINQIFSLNKRNYCFINIFLNREVKTIFVLTL